MKNKIERLLSMIKNIDKMIDNITLVLAVCAVACFSGWYFGGKVAEKESTERWIKAVDSTFEYFGYPGELPEMEVEINPFTMKTNIYESCKNEETYNDNSYEYDEYDDSYNYDSNYYVPEESEYNYNYNEFSNDSNNDGIPDNMVDSNHDGIPDGFSEVRH